MADLPLLYRARDLGAQESGLAVVVTSRADGTAQASVVNAGVLDHPVTALRVVGFVARGGARKLAHMRARPRVTMVFRSGKVMPSSSVPTMIRKACARATWLD